MTDQPSFSAGSDPNWSPQRADDEAWNRTIDQVVATLGSTPDGRRVTIPNDLWTELVDRIVDVARQASTAATLEALVADRDDYPDEGWTVDCGRSLVDDLAALLSRASRGGANLVAMRTVTLAAVVDRLLVDEAAP